MIQNLFPDQEYYTPISCNTNANTCMQTKPLFLAREHVLNLYINYRFTHRFICSPTHLVELCVGWLCSEGYINTVCDIQKLQISEDGHTAQVSLGAPRKSTPDLLPAFTPLNEPLLKRAATLMQSPNSVYSKTHGTHGCIYIDGAFSLFREDISRNNALDKTIGAALIQEIPIQKGIMFFSGRISSEIVLKTVYAGIATIASKATATAEALETASNFKQKLVFFNRGNYYTRENTTHYAEQG